MSISMERFEKLAIVEGVLDEYSMHTLDDWLDVLSTLNPHSELDMSQLECQSPSLGSQVMDLIRKYGLCMSIQPEWLDIAEQPV